MVEDVYLVWIRDVFFSTIFTADNNFTLNSRPKPEAAKTSTEKHPPQEKYPFGYYTSIESKEA